MPTDLIGQRNGYVVNAVLRTIQKPQGKLEQHAATAWNCFAACRLLQRANT
jgi:hypothetical protein